MEKRPGKKCIIVFLKSPEEGKVKSRLAETVGEATACRLYKNFTLDLLETLEKVSGEERCALQLYFHPPGSERLIVDWLGNGYRYVPQQGKDLGERMGNAFQGCFSEGFDSALLIGSDIPDLPDRIVKEGFASLQRSDAVIGPSLDGGYYLIGFKSDTFIGEVFEGISWGTAGVLKRTMKVFRQRKAGVSILPSWRDIDTYEDLKELLGRDENSRFEHSRTMRYLRSRMPGKTITAEKGGGHGEL